MAAPTEAAPPASFVFVAPDLAGGAPFDDARLAALEDRHIVSLAVPSMLQPLAPLLAERPTSGVVLALHAGLPTRLQRAALREWRRAGRAVLLYWPAEQAAEVLDGERLRLMSVQAHARRWVAQGRGARELARLVKRSARILVRTARRTYAEAVQGLAVEGLLAREAEPLPWALVTELRNSARPTTLALPQPPSPDAPLDGLGVYVRTDHWNPLSSGGSYGHTCYVAHELARSTRRFLCVLPHRYQLLDELGVPQSQLEAPDRIWDDYSVVRTSEPTRRELLTLLRALQPAYVYERLCPGNAGASAACRELRIPHVVEYNGSEISMSRSFGEQMPAQQALQLAIEDAAFRNAALVNVVSERVKDDLLTRGVPAERILVNPNGVDPQRYRPLEAAQRSELRASMGFEPGHCVIGFTGTFGGWHGIDVLAAAIPRICAAAPHARFLLIGDGQLRGTISDGVARHGLGDKVRMVGRVAQQQGARLLGACDLFVSPHSSHMVDQRFFGSPTKLFEYMATGGGIVASDLEQIGEVLTPGLRAHELESAPLEGPYRAVLCRPGDVDDFVEGVTKLVARPELARHLGANARRAAVSEFSWEQHVRRLWCALAEQSRAVSAPAAAAAALPVVAEDDHYKLQTQAHWNTEACGSQSAAGAVEPLSLEWYKDIERYRYQEYAPWMPEVMEFARHAGEDVLEIGGGVGTDLSQFAGAGARVVDVDLSAGHLEHARRNFGLRGLLGRFVHHDAETLPFEDGSFDLVYSNGVIHHTPNTARLVAEIKRVLRPGGRVIVMVYAQNSIHYWLRLFQHMGLEEGLLEQISMGEIMSRHVERGPEGTRPLVKVYSRRRLEKLFDGFTDIETVQRQLMPDERPRRLRWVPTDWLGKIGGWNLILKARKPQR